MRKRAGSIFACLLILSHGRPQLLCQTGNPATTPPPSSAETSLLDALQTEQHAGTYLFYTQSYVDSDNQRVTYNGSVYGFIKHAELKDCSLNVDFIVADRYSGVVKKQPTGSVEDDEEYSATIPLTHNIALSLSLVEAPPVAIANGTNSLCATRPSCAFTWLKIIASDSSIRETRTTNGLLDFAGNTKTFFLPISTPDAGKNLIQQIQSFTRCPMHLNRTRICLAITPCAPHLGPPINESVQPSRPLLRWNAPPFALAMLAVYLANTDKDSYTRAYKAERRGREGVGKWLAMWARCVCRELISKRTIPY